MRIRIGAALVVVALGAALVVAAASGAGTEPRGVGFELRRTSISPKHPLYDGKRETTLHYGFAANRPVDLKIRVLRAKSGNVVRVYRERDARPGHRLAREWNGLNRRGKAVDDGRYEFRVGPAGGPVRFAGRFRLHTHVFPVDGSAWHPWGDRGVRRAAQRRPGARGLRHHRRLRDADWSRPGAAR